MFDIILDTLMDAIKLLPFLFVAFLIIELIEHKLSNKSKDVIISSGKIGPFLGAILGVIPQCGFSVMATNLYTTRIVTLGTLIAVYLSTSDEMLPILLSENVDISVIIEILLIKFIIAVFFGFLIDFVLRKNNSHMRENYDICNLEECHCNDHLFLSTLKHTLNTLVFIILITFILNMAFYYVGEEYLKSIFLKNNLLSPFITSIIGLIPNCGASVVITELYINGAISLSACISGLLTGSGVALLVLFKSNKNMKENVSILILLYLIGAISGVIISLIEMIL